MDMIRRVTAGRVDELADPQARRALVIELFRQLAVLDFETLHNSPGWRTCPALQATLLSLTDRGLRDQVRAALARAGQHHLARAAPAGKIMADLLGFRLRADCGATFETLATPLDATMNGLLMTALTHPGQSAQCAEAWPFGAPAPAQWSLPALGLGAIATAFTEPDPEFTWDDGRAAALRWALTAPGRAERPEDSPSDWGRLAHQGRAEAPAAAVGYLVC